MKNIIEKFFNTKKKFPAISFFFLLINDVYLFYFIYFWMLINGQFLRLEKFLSIFKGVGSLFLKLMKEWIKLHIDEKSQSEISCALSVHRYNFGSTINVQLGLNCLLAAILTWPIDIEKNYNFPWPGSALDPNYIQSGPWYLHYLPTTCKWFRSKI